MPSPARRLALRVLRDVSAGGGTLADALAGRTPETFDERERGFLNELVLGVLRRRGWLDHVLGGLIDRPLPRVPPATLDALRLGAYQLLFLRVAPHAAVSETVDLVREHQPQAAGFANAVLRRLQRDGPPAEPDANADALVWLTTWGSLPSWLAAKWLGDVGRERALARARAALEPPRTFFRTNPRVPDALARLDAAAVRARSVAPPGALELESGRLAALQAEGVVYVQDAASQMVAHLAACGGRIYDACAAPGGKTLLLADSADAPQVLAGERSLRRAKTLAALRLRWGARRVLVVAGDATRPPCRPGFDSVLLDAPCSGLGTLARHPDIRWRIRQADVDRHSARQRELIESVAALVRPGGRLVYAACSLEPEETERVLRPFLSAHPEFAIEPLPSWANAHEAEGVVRIEPGTHGEGFFAARLRKAP